MIGYIKGIVEEVTSDRLILENGGIGYEIFVPSSVLDSGLREGEELKIYTYLNVREDALQLFGFLSRDDLQVYRLLIGVNGIGPKAAIGVLSAMSADTLRFAVLADDAAAIAKAPGIGKKTAQKLILELKDKFSLEEAFEQKLAATQAKETVQAGEDASSEAVQALVALGYSGTEALQAVKKVAGAADMDTEAVLKAALKYLF
ncbi:Holliday junction branch migration protein RuvA [Lacrimispora saccharolytica]|nr:Holliday junction branch migration protein RuvA [Lacrimispora saccharolytica]